MTYALNYIIDPQMILLYRDPHRQNSGGATSQTDQSGFSSQMRTSKRVELEKKVTQLEKTVQEKEKTISELRTRIEVTQLSAVMLLLDLIMICVYLRCVLWAFLQAIPDVLCRAIIKNNSDNTAI